MPINKTSYVENIYWVFGIVIKDKININAIDFINALKNKGIEQDLFLPNIYSLFKMVYLKMKIYIADKLYKKGFHIPSGLGSKNQIRNYQGYKEILYEKYLIFMPNTMMFFIMIKIINMKQVLY